MAVGASLQRMLPEVSETLVGARALFLVYLSLSRACQGVVWRLIAGKRV